jgi:hypothetical protein
MFAIVIFVRTDCTFDSHILLQAAETDESHRFSVIHIIEFQKYKIEKLVLKLYIRSFVQMSNEIVEIMSRVNRSPENPSYKRAVLWVCMDFIKEIQSRGWKYRKSKRK